MYYVHRDIQEPKKDQPIWLYYSFVKFLWMIDKSSLYLCRHDKFDDGFEGGLTEKDKEFLEKIHPGLSDNMESDRAGCYYSNCWVKNEVDEYVLWSTYSSIKEGIAVKTTVERLIQSFDETDERKIMVSDVLYLDYEQDYSFMKTNGKVNTLAPHFTKRPFFSSEKELRVMYVDMMGKYDTSPEGIEVKVNLSKLIERVYVSPFSSPWLKGIVENILDKYGLKGIKVYNSAI